MTKIEWGAEIAVDGVKPEWLGLDEVCGAKNHEGIWYDFHHQAKEYFWNWREGKITAIRLPVDHPYYLATSKGFTYWPGGGAAPDGVVEVLLRDASEYPTIGNWDWSNRGRDSDIIGYKRKAEAKPSVDWTKPIEAVRKSTGEVFPLTFRAVGSKGHHYTHECPNDSESNNAWNEDGSDPCFASLWFVRNRVTDTVTIARMTEAEANRRVLNIHTLRELDLIREETRGERFTRETGYAVTEAVGAALEYDA